MKSPSAVPAFSKEAQLKRKIRKELRSLGFKQSHGQLIPPEPGDKETIRQYHLLQRKEMLSKNTEFLNSKSESLIKFIANGNEIYPEKIQLRLEQISANTWQSDLFRFASLTWSVPVSNGFGRRIRYLVWDDYNGKLAGIFALGDPVYNSRTRELHVGWNAATKKKRLVNLLDAYVLGAIPPYNALLVGKIIACLVRSKQVVDDFRRKYNSTVGLISKEAKNAELLAVTTSSSMGRSSVYNRLALDGHKFFVPIGYTEGWGHFHFSASLFSEIRDHLRSLGHNYADNSRFGSGPNWKMRTLREGMQSLGFDPNLLKHGIRRQSFLCSLADNSIQALQASADEPIEAEWRTIKDVSELSFLGVQRWAIPRATRMPVFTHYKREKMLSELEKLGSPKTLEIDFPLANRGPN
ncbi:Druantia anti-phage system protein DruA [uncultured Pelagimonas sp.]|uniref:Druantia anti-phage system protein DruA n=1 Tax=uncultured Pelagimonas sp. TaxID=1618102 RepID=UPI0026346105|nr:Druantia anti-phage system protein DruA [uncultured Pelagimonas sp.]